MSARSSTISISSLASWVESDDGCKCVSPWVGGTSSSSLEILCEEHFFESLKMWKDLSVMGELI